MGTFTGRQDQSAHLKMFRTWILICGGTDAIKYKMFAGTLVGAALDWFSSLPKASITSLEVFTKLFISHFSESRAKPLEIVDLF